MNLYRYEWYQTGNRFAPSYVIVIRMGVRPVKRILQPELMRGHIAQRAAILLLLGLLMVLLASVLHGVQGLRS